MTQRKCPVCRNPYPPRYKHPAIPPEAECDACNNADCSEYATLKDNEDQICLYSEKAAALAEIERRRK